MSVWALTIGLQDEYGREDLMENQAERTAILMAESEGYPQNWEENIGTGEKYIPGFATEERALNENTIEEFTEQDEEYVRDILRVQNYHIKFENTEGEEIAESGTPPENEDTSIIIPYETNVLIRNPETGENYEATMRYIVWE